MFCKKGFIKLALALNIGVFILLGSGALDPAACAEQVYDVTVCVSVDRVPLIRSPEITITTYEGKGIMLSNDKGMVFDNCTVHYMGVTSYEGKNKTAICYLKYLDPDGDFVIFRYTQNPGETVATTKLLMGTGKWKGITGGGIITRITKGKAVAENTSQHCNNHKGTFTLPK